MPGYDPPSLLGKAEVEIRADSSKLDTDLAQGEAKVKSFGNAVEENQTSLIGAAGAASLLAVALQRLYVGYQQAQDAARQLSEEQRKIIESFTSGEISAGLPEYDAAIKRITKQYEEQNRLLDAQAQNLGAIQRFAEFVTGGSENEVLRQNLETARRQGEEHAKAHEKNRLELERSKQLEKEREAEAKRYEDRQNKIRDILGKINEEAANAGLDESQKLERERQKRIDQIGQYENEVGREVTEEAVANINKIYDEKQKKIEEEKRKEEERIREKAEKEAKAFTDAIDSVYKAAAEAQKNVFDVKDIKTHLAQIGQLLGIMAQQRRAI